MQRKFEEKRARTTVQCTERHESCDQKPKIDADNSKNRKTKGKQTKQI